MPFGGVTAPTLCLVYINDLVKDIPARVKAAIYADNLELWCNKHMPTMHYQMQQAVNTLKSLTDKWHVIIILDKTSTSLFSPTHRETRSLTYTVRQLNNITHFTMARTKMPSSKQSKSSKQSTSCYDLRELHRHPVTRWPKIRHFVESIRGVL